MENNPKLELDILHQVEKLTEEVNRIMEPHGRSALRRYPLTFTLLALFGVVAVSEGVKGVLEELGIFAEHPGFLLLAGLVILVITGSLYKKLDKKVD